MSRRQAEGADLAAKHATQPLVSIVMPVHNTERYIFEAIASVRRQTYSNWELVVADNASTDASLEIAASEAEQDSRIRVVEHSQFVDVISSFNRAFRLISPKAQYCKALSADDGLLPECLERMVELAERDYEIGLVGAYRLVQDKVDFFGVLPTVEVVAGKDMCRASLLGGVWVFGSSSSTMIRADLVRRRDPFYDPTLIHADLAACYDVLQQSSFGFVHRILTYTRRHAATVSTGAAALMTHRGEGVLIYQRFAPACLERREYERRLAVLVANYLSELLKHPARLLRADVRLYHAGLLRRLLEATAPGQLRRGIFLQLRRLLSGSRENGADWLAQKYGGRART